MQGPNIKRLYYSTAEVSKLVQVQPYVIRKWESKFSFLNSVKKQSGRKLFKPDDVETLKKIKKLKEIGYTDDKINELMVKEDNALQHITFKSNQSHTVKSLLQEIYRELHEILRILNNNTL